ncbi:MAG: bidirectional hydrogenase complex protein HoxE [Pirellulales bacterium]
MARPLKKPAAPSSDKRWRIVDAAMRRNGYKRNGLIETLHAVQKSFGYVDDASLRYVAAALRVPLSTAYGVVTFYHFFTLKPPGKHTCVVCTGTACYIRGAQPLLENLCQQLSVREGETTPDGQVSLLTARCIGSCGLAPVAVLDGEVAPKVTAEQLTSIVEGWRHGEPG